MNDVEAHFRSAHGRLEEAVVVLDEVERALAAARNAEVKAEREGAFIVRTGVVVAGAAVAVVVGILFLRWFFEEPEAEPDESVGPEGLSDQPAETA